MGNAYVEIIGPERENDKALEETKKKIGEDLCGLIANPKDIQSDSDIYLVAHGDDGSALGCKSARLGDKAPAQVAARVKEILRVAGFDQKNKFAGRIIFEGCHTAEPILGEQDQQQLKVGFEEMDKVPNTRLRVARVAQLLKSKANERPFIQSESFLFKVKEILSRSRIFSPETRIGGYLGAAFDGDYNKSGYGVAATTNPPTVKFQRGRGVEGRDDTGGIFYDENSSYVEARIGEQLVFGDRGRS